MILSSMSVITIPWMTVIPKNLERILCRMSNRTYELREDKTMGCYFFQDTKWNCKNVNKLLREGGVVMTPRPENEHNSLFPAWCHGVRCAAVSQLVSDCLDVHNSYLVCSATHCLSYGRWKTFFLFCFWPHMRWSSGSDVVGAGSAQAPVITMRDPNGRGRTQWDRSCTWGEETRNTVVWFCCPSGVSAVVFRTISGPRSRVWHPRREWSSLPGCNSIPCQYEGLFPLRQTVVSLDARVEAARRRPRWTGRGCAGAVAPGARLASRDKSTTKPAQDSCIPSDEWPRTAQLQHSASSAHARCRASLNRRWYSLNSPRWKLHCASFLARWYENSRWHKKDSSTVCLSRRPHEPPRETYCPTTQKTTDTAACPHVSNTNRK